MIIELSAVSQGIPFGDDFTVEERWIVAEESASDGSPFISIVVSSGTKWEKVSFSASFLKGIVSFPPLSLVVVSS